MVQPAARNFDVHVGDAEQERYPLRVLESPAGVALTPVWVADPQNDSEIQRAIRALYSLTVEGETVLDLGRRLAAFLFPHGVIRDLYFRSRGSVNDAGQGGLRIRLSIDPPELAALPWEYLYEESSGYLGLDARTLLIRYPQQAAPALPLLSRLPAPILVLIADPDGYPALRAVEEARNILQALAHPLQSGQVVAELLFSGGHFDRQRIALLVEGQTGVRLLEEPASVMGLQTAIRRGYRVIHFIGHGWFEPQSGGHLVLADALRTPEPLAADELAQLVRGSQTALFVLNACESATEGTTRSFLGLGSSLIRAGLSAVLAMQYPITDISAAHFGRVFYTALADGLPLDAAVTDGRKAIYTLPAPYKWEWGKPVLYMRTADAMLWEAAVDPEGLRQRIEQVGSRLPAVADETRGGRPALDPMLVRGVRLYTERLRRLVDEPPNLGSNNPYRDLLPYRLNDAHHFFGRDQAIEQLLQRIRRDPLTVLHAESGAGKSSLIQAGVAPRLIAQGGMPLILRPYDLPPSLALKTALLPDASALANFQATPLREFLHQVEQILGPETSLYLFLDQFEEFFTYTPPAMQSEFVRELAECLEDETLSVRWVLALRSEAFSRLASFRPRIRYPFANDVHLDRLTHEEGREAIVRPLQTVGIQYEDRLVEQILQDLGGTAILPPQMQLICTALIQALPADSTMITRTQYDELGGAAGILQGHLERVLNRDLAPEQRGQARLLLASLVTSEVRRVARTAVELAAELQPLGVQPDMLRQLLDQLIDSRLVLLRSDGRQGAEPVYELTHDYLAAEIDLDPAVRSRKTAQELLERELLNWRLFGALLGPKTLEVIGAQQDVLYIDETAMELLLRSAFEENVELERWLARAPAGLAQRVFLDALAADRPAIRVRAATWLASATDPTVHERLAHHAAHDPAPEVRQAALQSLATAGSPLALPLAREALTHPEARQRALAVRVLAHFLDQEVADALFLRVCDDKDTFVWQSALAVLTQPETAPYRRQWRPLLRAPAARQAEIEQEARRLALELPQAVTRRLWVARLQIGLDDLAQRRAPLVVFRVLLGIALTTLLIVAWAQGSTWWIMRSWQPVPELPQVMLRAVATVQGELIVGSYAYGVAWHRANATWGGWQRAGLPTALQATTSKDPTANVRAITSIAIDPKQGEHVYVTIRDGGVARYVAEQSAWHLLRGAPLNTASLCGAGSLRSKSALYWGCRRHPGVRSPDDGMDKLG